MKQSLSQSTSSTPFWPWPLPIERYDRSPGLCQEEYEALVHLFEQPHGQIRPPTKRILKRLVEPLEDVLRYVCAPKDFSAATIRIVCIEMYERKCTFWAWSVDDWLVILGPNVTVFSQRYHWKDLRHPARAYLPLIVYLLKVTPDTWGLLERGQIYPLAQRCFGKAAIDAGIGRLRTVLLSWGINKETIGVLPHV